MLLQDLCESQSLFETVGHVGRTQLVARGPSVASIAKDTTESCITKAVAEENKTEAIRLYERAKTLALDAPGLPLDHQEAVHSHSSAIPFAKTQQTGSVRQELAHSLAEKLRTAEDRINRDLRFDTSRDSLNNVRRAKPAFLRTVPPLTFARLLHS